MLTQGDGTITYRYENGRVKTISMDGKTPYGLKIKKKTRHVVYKKKSVVIIYSAQKSDDVLSKGMEPFFKELVSQTRRWMVKKGIPHKSMKMVISNCRFGKTGYCGRKKRKAIWITSYLGKKKHRTVSLTRFDTLGDKRHVTAAWFTVRVLLSK